MKKRLPWILLLISGALNVFFIGGAVYSMIVSERLADDPEARTAFVADRLDLSPEEHQALAAWQQRTRERWGEMRSGSRDLRKLLLAELAKPELDLEKIDALMRERAEMRVPAMLATVTDLHDYLATISDEEKSEFITMAREPFFFRRLLRGEQAVEGAAR